jgi:hypothetical protein
MKSFGKNDKNAHPSTHVTAICILPTADCVNPFGNCETFQGISLYQNYLQLQQKIPICDTFVQVCASMKSCTARSITPNNSAILYAAPTGIRDWDLRRNMSFSQVIL